MSNGLIIFIYCIAVYGLANMIVFGSGPFRIFEHIRYITSSLSEQFGKLFQCMMCLPANIGIVASVIDWFLLKKIAITPFNIMLSGTNLWWLAILGDLAFASGMTWLIHNIESFFEKIGDGDTITEYEDVKEDDAIEVNG